MFEELEIASCELISLQCFVDYHVLSFVVMYMYLFSFWLHTPNLRVPFATSRTLCCTSSEKGTSFLKGSLSHVSTQTQTRVVVKVQKTVVLSVQCSVVTKMTPERDFPIP